MKKVFIVFLAFAGIGGVAVWQWYDSGINERQVRYERRVLVVFTFLVVSLTGAAHRHQGADGRDDRTGLWR